MKPHVTPEAIMDRTAMRKAITAKIMGQNDPT